MVEQSDGRYVCPQCGPDPAGAERHAEKAHTWPAATDGRREVDLREDGLLWLINRVVFHPRGYALAVGTEDDAGKFFLLGDGSEPWSYVDTDEARATGKDEDSLFDRVRQILT
jgi:hypothetical protein